MKEITNMLNNYRESSRHLWNTYFRDKIISLKESDDLLDLYEEIDKLLFSALVLVEINKYSYENEFGKKPLPFISIIPIESNDGIPIMINRPSSDRNFYWDDPINRIDASEAKFSFISYYDWDNYGYRDFAYYRVRITASSKYPNLVGRDALLLTSYASAYFEEEKNCP